MNNNQSESIAILGGAGFLGSRIARLFDNNNKNYFIGDINSSVVTSKHKIIDVECQKTLNQLEHATSIINLAAVHRDDVQPISRYDDVNVQGATNVCEVARRFDIKKIIFTSSVAIFGFAPPDTDESGSPNYFNDYGRTKYLAEQVYKKWQAEDSENRTLVIVRPTVIFGEGNRGNVYNLLRQIASRRFVMFGNGKNKKSMAYVENVAAFIDYSYSFRPGLHIYNYIDKPDYDMNALVSDARDMLFGKKNIGLRLPSFLGMTVGYFADVFTKVFNINLPISSIRVKKFMGTTQFASSISSTDFEPPFKLEDGLAKTIRYEFLEDNSDKQTFETE